MLSYVITLHTNYGDVLLLDRIYWIAVYYSDPYKKCSALPDAVHAVISEMIQKFQYMSNIGNLEEYLYCTFCSNKTTEHFVSYRKTKQHLYTMKAVLL